MENSARPCSVTKERIAGAPIIAPLYITYADEVIIEYNKETEAPKFGISKIKVKNVNSEF